jgi:hypothetical protein
LATISTHAGAACRHVLTDDRRYGFSSSSQNAPAQHTKPEASRRPSGSHTAGAGADAACLGRPLLAVKAAAAAKAAAGVVASAARPLARLQGLRAPPPLPLLLLLLLQQR